MKRILARALLLAALLGGWVVPVLGGPYMSSYYNKEAPEGVSNGVHAGPPDVPTVVGPWGQPVSMAFPYSAAPPNGEDAARAMLAQSVPFNLQMAYMAQNGIGNPLIPPPSANYGMGMPMGGMPMGGMPGMNLSPTPAGVPALPAGLTGQYTMPGMGVVQAGGSYDQGGGIMQTAGPYNDKNILRTAGPGAPPPFPVQRTQVRFATPAGMKISWYTTQPDGKQGFGAQSLEAPGRYNFLQAAIYRLKLSDIPNRPGVELYPTLEVVPCNSKTSTFLAHSAVPVSFTDEDLDQIASGNMVVKVIYLPDPQFQDLATTGLAEVVSSQLEPGVDPIQEAQRRGSILLVVRISNIDLEANNTPGMDAPGPNRGPAGPPQGQVLNMQPNTNGMSRMVPYTAVPTPNSRPTPNNFPYPTVPSFQAMPPQQQQQQGGPPQQGQLPPGNIQAPQQQNQFGQPNPFGQSSPFGQPNFLGQPGQQQPQGQPASRPLFPNPALQPGQSLPATPGAPGSELAPPPPLPARPLPPPLGPMGQAPTSDSGIQQVSAHTLTPIFLPGQR